MWKIFHDQVSSLATFADGKLTIVQTAKKAGEKSTTVNMLDNTYTDNLMDNICFQSVREMNGAEMLYTLTVEGCDIVCVQKFKKL